jgi:hypothetical protein
MPAWFSNSGHNDARYRSLSIQFSPEQCIATGLVEGEQMSVDGSFIMANASHHSRIPREQFTEAAQVNYGARKYLEELEQENGDGEPIHEQDKVSTTDPDSTYLTKGNRAAELGYFDNYLIDNESCVIVGVQATAARLSQESAAARDMIDRYCERYGRRPKGVAADNTYVNGEMLQWLDERGITPYIRVKEGPNSPRDLYGIEKFTYVPEENRYVCPAGKPLNYVGINKRNRVHRYYSTAKRCRGCEQKPQCTRGQFRTIRECRTDGGNSYQTHASNGQKSWPLHVADARKIKLTTHNCTSSHSPGVGSSVQRQLGAGFADSGRLRDEDRYIVQTADPSHAPLTHRPRLGCCFTSFRPPGRLENKADLLAKTAVYFRQCSQ